jgi:hypothetical protein
MGVSVVAFVMGVLAKNTLKLKPNPRSHRV